MHNLWRLGVVAMADPITNYFRVENACAPNMKTYVTFIAVVGRATPTHPPPPNLRLCSAWQHTHNTNTY